MSLRSRLLKKMKKRATNTITLKKDGIKLIVDKDKFEIISMKKNGCEFMYQRKDAWQKTYPTMFPICGSLKNNSFTYDGKTYTMQQHGFWKDFTWDVKEVDGRLVAMVKNESGFHMNYPFKFQVRQEISILDAQVHIKTNIKNVGEQRMFFNFGHHPAFQLHGKAGIHFETEEKFAPVYTAYLDSRSEYTKVTNMNVKTWDFETADSYFSKNSKSRSILLDNGKQGLEIRHKAPHIVLWKTNNKSSFICIEPTYGLPDKKTDEVWDITQKPNMQSIAPDDSFSDVIIFKPTKK